MNFSRATFSSNADDKKGMAATVVEGTARKQVTRKCANPTLKRLDRESGLHGLSLFKGDSRKDGTNL